MSRTPKPKKRKASQISKTNNAYRNLLNTTIQELTQPPPPHPSQPFSTTQIGLTIWSAEEKDLFFNAVGKVGRWDVEGIASRMGKWEGREGNGKGKSVLEIRQYIDLLEKGVREVGGRLGMEEMEAAREISAECCEALDEVAGFLEAKERKAGEGVERGGWGEEGWLVDREKAVELKDRVDSTTRFDRVDGGEGNEEGGNGDGKEEVLEKVFGLLDPANFLALSGHLFMNTAAPLDNNWQSIVSRNGEAKSANGKEEPAIRMTGLRDFHNLTISVTRRIVATAYYCAESRLKATFVKGDRPKKRDVRRKDVWAALKMLGLEANSERWWENVAKRCGVDAFGGNERRGSGNDSSKGRPEQAGGEEDESEEEAIDNSTDSSSEDESSDENVGHEDEEEEVQKVEMLPITTPRRPDQPEDSNSNSKNEEPPNNQDTASQTSHLSHHSLKSHTSTSSNSSTPSSTAPLNLLDTHASHLEEQNLWALLNRTPPPHLDLSVPEIPKKKERAKHYVARKIGEDAVERWRERIEYWSEWEVMRGGTVGREEFLGVGVRKGGGGYGGSSGGEGSG